ncbi:phosphoribosylamine--glycine ligase [Marine Group I thaumarchaeote]|uniref:Phosphoribosylamine--glycine ligase n=1 Tax=Marine Group I thaumarchaeote TaxID=2511932 RepID=A0A7K4MR80_9ARCH|nr:phosphoribosylamine--glycine ligase [Marine Group I thaumarchaeote]
MKVFVVGNGGREDSICWKLRREDVEVFKSSESIFSENNDLVIIGPEAPIAEGLVDELESKDIPVFGPTKLAGQLETSKVWAKHFMQRHDIPTSNFRLLKRKHSKWNNTIISNYIISRQYPIVIKEDGLCGGKGVVVCKDRLEVETALTENFSINKFNSSSDNFLIEDFVEGVEASCFVLTDGKDYKILPYCQDHKPVGEGNTGPNTGGMGAFCPTSRITEKLKKRIEKEIVIPTLDGMREEGLPYKGVLYIGLMIKEDGSPYVIEYNVRFGDPECQVLMMLLKSELYPLLKSVAEGNLGEQPDPEFYDGSALTVVMCSEGYPGEYEKGHEIDWENQTHFSTPDMQVFHAGIKWEGDRYVTDGGRVLNVTARGSSLEDARERAYKTVERISWKGSFYRNDIGQ